MDYSLFVDPQTHEPLTLNGEVLAAPGRTQYRIERGIPRFTHSENYARAFGLQWNMFRRTQLDSYTGRAISETRLAAAFGQPLSELRGLRVLEAGSGAGRFTEVLLKHGALVYSFDYSNAVDSNAMNNIAKDNLTLFQADIESIPLASDSVDAAVCLGVLQHTQSTKTSLRELHRVLRSGGRLVCDHYKWHLGAFTSLYLPYWIIIKQFNPHTQALITDFLTQFFFPIHWTFRHNDIAQIILRRVSPINFYYGRYDLTKKLHFEWSRLDTHDRNTDHFKRHITRRQFERILQLIGFREIEVSVGGTGYVASAIK